MSAEQALQIVRGISSAVTGVERSDANDQEMRAAAGRVCTSLMFFIEHPDSRVQVHCVGMVRKCYERYRDAISEEDMPKVRQAYANCVKMAAEDTLIEDKKTALNMLGWIVSRADGAEFARSYHDDELDVTSKAKDQGGQVALKEPLQQDNEELRASLLEQVIKMPQVVSVTFEAEFVIVATRTAADARNANFLADLLNVMMEQGAHGVSLVNSRTCGTSALTGGSCATSSTAMPAEGGRQEESNKAGQDQDQEATVPAYLDDELDQGAAERLGAEHLQQGDSSLPQWTFFSQQSWLDQRKLQEYEDDPSIAARLAKKKQQQQQKHEEETSRISRFTSWLVGWQKDKA
ncbi:unnamed protein product [Symbiodinium pilosum]|uniref:Uncharacterized protein n=1 Tax=Symbiodinium pilosum TaxID=2952 RepID=A0A812QJG5_SYMPI|nr:unnamed protein product [Symbiodinium pilosum]